MVPSDVDLLGVFDVLFIFFLPPSFNRDRGVHSEDEKLPHYILNSNSYLIYSMYTKSYWLIEIWR